MAAPSLDEETVKKVIRQVEFYFSDSNLPRDKFLSQTISDSDDGLVSLALICSFSRMRNHLKLENVKPEEVSEDTVKAVAETLRNSTFLKVSEDGKKVGRTNKLLKPEEVIEQIDNRTVAASPLEYDLKLEDVESFFGQFAKVNSVRLPRHIADKRLFCGTALIEFSSEEDAEKVLKQSFIYAGAELELKPKKDFDAVRAKQAEEVVSSCVQVGANSKSSEIAESNYPKGLIVAFTLKRTEATDFTEQNGGHDPANETGNTCKSDGESDSISKSTEVTEEMSEDVKNDEQKLGEAIEESKEIMDEKNSLEIEGQATEVQKNLEGPTENDENKATVEGKPHAVLYKDNKDVVLREDLKAIFQKYGIVKYIDFNFGEDSGYVRFDEPEAAQKARAAAALTEEGGLVVKNFIATLDPVTGEAEREYWSLLRGSREDRYRDIRANRGRGGRNNRGGRNFNGKRSHDRKNDSANRSNKFQKAGAA